MPELILHPTSQAALQQISSQAILLTGPDGSGKGSAARQLAERLLDLTDLSTYPYARILGADEATIDAIRQLQHFLALTIPSAAAKQFKQTYNRAIIIEQAESMGHEAQNSLLKLLEEPPVGAVFILTTSQPLSILPTIRSRVQQVPLQKPTPAALQTALEARGHQPTAVTQAIRMADGLPGRALVLLGSEADHPLYTALVQARELLQQTTYERLLQVDALAKQKPQVVQTISMLEQMAHAALSTGQASHPDRWQRIMQAAYQAQQQLAANTQTKLVLTNLMLQL